MSFTGAVGRSPLRSNRPATHGPLAAGRPVLPCRLRQLQRERILGAAAFALKGVGQLATTFFLPYVNPWACPASSYQHRRDLSFTPDAEVGYRYDTASPRAVSILLSDGV